MNPQARLKASVPTIADIGDLIDSKAIQNCFEFQKRFARVLADINKWQAESPFSLPSFLLSIRGN